MFISPAFAQAEGAAGSAGVSETLLGFAPIILIFVVFYFLLIRPQQKRMKQHRDALSAIRRGDRIVTGGGIIGRVTKIVADDEIQVEIAEGVRVTVQRGLVAQVLARTEVPDEVKSTSGGQRGRKRQRSQEPEPEDELEADHAPEPQQGEPPTKPEASGSMLKKLLGGREQ